MMERVERREGAREAVNWPEERTDGRSTHEKTTGLQKQ